MTNLPPNPYGPAGSGPPNPQPPYDLAQFYPQASGYNRNRPTPPPPEGNGPGLASLIVGLVSIGVAFIPIVNFLSFILGVAGVVLGIIGLVLANRPRGQAIWGTVLSFVSIVLAAIMVVAYAFGFIFAIGDAVDDPLPNPPSVTATPEPLEPGEPLPLGSAVEFEGTDGESTYVATVTAYDLDATEDVLAVEGNSAAPTGMTWAMVTLAAAPLDPASSAPGSEIAVEYLAANGTDIYGAFDELATAPEPAFAGFTAVAVDETVVGNVVIAIPSDDAGDGLWALRYSGIEGSDGPYFFEVD